jgi:hypothetical protein
MPRRVCRTRRYGGTCVCSRTRDVAFGTAPRKFACVERSQRRPKPGKPAARRRASRAILVVTRIGASSCFQSSILRDLTMMMTETMAIKSSGAHNAILGLLGHGCEFVECHSRRWLYLAELRRPTPPPTVEGCAGAGQTGQGAAPQQDLPRRAMQAAAASKKNLRQLELARLLIFTCRASTRNLPAVSATGRFRRKGRMATSVLPPWSFARLQVRRVGSTAQKTVRIGPPQNRRQLSQQLISQK